MARKADSEVVKMKRRVIKLKSDLETVADKLKMFIGYAYAPDQWPHITKDFDESMLEVHDVTEKRYRAAKDIADAKRRKRQYNALVSSGTMSTTQASSYDKAKKELTLAIKAMTKLPDLGTSQREWDALPASFKAQDVGHPKITMEEVFVTTLSEMKMTLKKLNDIEDENSKSTIDSILEEEDSIVINAGRKKLPNEVMEIEDLERKKRSTLGDIGDIESESDTPEVKTGRGKRKLSKDIRITKKKNLLVSIQDEISRLESKLSPEHYALRFKRVLEREKRYAKQEGRKRDLTSLTKKMDRLSKLIKNIELGKKTGHKAIEDVDNIINGVDITIDNAINELVSESLTEGKSDSDADTRMDVNPESIVENVFSSMELPKF